MKIYELAIGTFTALAVMFMLINHPMHDATVSFDREVAVYRDAKDPNSFWCFGEATGYHFQACTSDGFLIEEIDREKRFAEIFERREARERKEKLEAFRKAGYRKQ